jgi:hypothetical protein
MYSLITVIRSLNFIRCGSNVFDRTDWYRAGGLGLVGRGDGCNKLDRSWWVR